MIRNKANYRAAEPKDDMAIGAVIERAFGRTLEAELVTALRHEAVETRGFIAEIDGLVIGYVFYSQLTGPDRCMALGPLAVDPDWRDFQIGTQLVRCSIAALIAENWKSVFVLGDPVYYGRFGFKRELAEHVVSQYQGIYLTALELQKGALANYRGPITYAPPFSQMAP